jgi:hypothetical protein
LKAPTFADVRFGPAPSWKHPAPTLQNADSMRLAFNIKQPQQKLYCELGFLQLNSFPSYKHVPHKPANADRRWGLVWGWCLECALPCICNTDYWISLGSLCAWEGGGGPNEAHKTKHFPPPNARQPIVCLGMSQLLPKHSQGGDNLD